MYLRAALQRFSAKECTTFQDKSVAHSIRVVRRRLIKDRNRAVHTRNRDDKERSDLLLKNLPSIRAAKAFGVGPSLAEKAATIADLELSIASLNNTIFYLNTMIIECSHLLNTTEIVNK